MDVKLEKGVAYWLVEKYQLARQQFKIIAIFDDEPGAKQYADLMTDKAEPAITNGVRSFDQLVDCLISDRYFPLENMTTDELRRRLKEREELGQRV